LVTGKVRRNLASVRGLMGSYKSVRGRVGDLGLDDSALASRLVSFFGQRDIEEPERWTPPIAIDKSWWGISFDKWQFAEQLSLDKVQLTVLETDLPVVQDDEADEQLSGLVGQQVLIPSTRRKMNRDLRGCSPSETDPRA
jgi:DNA phosphorothioation-dependent restriction protein DptH